MSRRTAAAIAAGLLGLWLAMLVPALLLGLARGSSVGLPVRAVDIIGQTSYLSLPILGLFIAWYLPKNPLWILSSAGAITLPLQTLATEYALLGLRIHSVLPAAGFAAWLSVWVWAVPSGFGTVAVMLIYPDGKLLGPAWRWPLVVVGVATVAIAAVLSLQPGPIIPGVRLANPLGVQSATPYVIFASNASNVVPALAALIGVVGLIVRYRRALGDQRQQIKWFAYAGAIFLAAAAFSGWAFTVASTEGPLNEAGIVVAGLSVILFPVAVGIGVLRYRLFDIDVVISRTLVYAALAIFITGVYIGIVVGIGSLVGGGSKPNLGLSILATALVAIAFQPLRERLTRIANRLVYGRRASPYEVLADFSRQVGASYAADEALLRMAQVLAEGTGAESAAVFVGERQVASYPPSANGGSGAEAHRLEVQHQGRRLGRLEVRKRRGEQLTPAEEKLFADLAHQAALVLSNLGLTDELSARLEELHASRQRLVQAQDEERRRLERNLQDGAQQRLAALQTRLASAQSLAEKEPAAALPLLAELQGDADQTLALMRELAHGIYPPLLAERGLREALESQARRATLPVTVEAENIGRYPQAVEAAIYFCCVEALQNVQRYARATSADIRLREQGGLLTFEVVDDGVGFDPASAAPGAGLTNLRDRLDALNGDLVVVSKPGAGTRVGGSVPIPPAAQVS
ncbi:MAG TPA: histidine kinase [Candidatus Dormibacteraeota bacterium]